jgi:hypothetical protein
MLNYTNPMAMLCQAMQKTTKVNVTGLCHSVQGTAHMLAAGRACRRRRWTTSAPASTTSRGISLHPQGPRPLSRPAQAASRTDKEIYNAEQVRNEMFLAFDYYVTESSGHNSEYNWWFRKRPELIEKYCTHGTNWNPGHYRLHPQRVPQERTRTRGRTTFRNWIDNPGLGEAGASASSCWPAAASMPRTSSTPGLAASSSASTATSSTRATSSPTCPRTAAWRFPCWPRAAAIRPMPRRRAAAPGRAADLAQRHLRDAGRRGRPRRRSAQGLSRPSPPIRSRPPCSRWRRSATW